MSNTVRSGSRLALTLALALGMGACGVLEPRLPEAAPEVPAEWPLPPTSASASATTATSVAAAGSGVVPAVAATEFGSDVLNLV